MSKRKEKQLRKLTVNDLAKILRDNNVKGRSKLSRKAQKIEKILELGLDISGVKSTRVKRVVSEERKQQLREQLKRAREKKMFNNPPLPPNIDTSSFVQEGDDFAGRIQDEELRDRFIELQGDFIPRQMTEEEKREDMELLLAQDIDIKLGGHMDREPLTLPEDIDEIILPSLGNEFQLNEGKMMDVINLMDDLRVDICCNPEQAQQLKQIIMLNQDLSAEEIFNKIKPAFPLREEAVELENFQDIRDELIKGEEESEDGLNSDSEDEGIFHLTEIPDSETPILFTPEEELELLDIDISGIETPNSELLSEIERDVEQREGNEFDKLDLEDFINQLDIRIANLQKLDDAQIPNIDILDDEDL